MVTRRAKVYSKFWFSSLAENWGVYAKLIYKYQISLSGLHNDSSMVPPCEWYRFVSQPEIAKNNPQNPVFWRSRSFKVTEFGANRKPVYDFLLVINLAPLLRHSDLLPKNRKFCLPPSYLPPSFDPLRIYEKVLRFLKLESSRQPMVKIWWF